MEAEGDDLVPGYISHLCRTGYRAAVISIVVAAASALAPGMAAVGSELPALAGRHATILAQNEEEQEDSVSSKQVEQYIAVYRSMQHDHSLTIGQACARQGLTVAAFRDIENKIERNDQIRIRVRKALSQKAAAASGPAGSHQQ